MTVHDTIYRESFLKGTPFYHEEIPASRLGVSGEPVPYSLINDSLVAMAMVFCILVTMITVARSWRLICFQTKNLFRVPRENSAEMRETSAEMRYQTYFCLQGVVLLGILATSVTAYYLGNDFKIGNYAVLGVFCSVFTAYYITRELLTMIVHNVFFESKERHLDNISRLFFMAAQGAVLLPITLLHIYFQLSMEATLRLLAVTVALPMALHYYKSYNIFFRKRNAVMPFLLYLCTLEAVPLALLGGALLVIGNYLTQNI